MIFRSPIILAVQTISTTLVLALRPPVSLAPLPGGSQMGYRGRTGQHGALAITPAISRDQRTLPLAIRWVGSYFTIPRPQHLPVCPWVFSPLAETLGILGSAVLQVLSPVPSSVPDCPA